MYCIGYTHLFRRCSKNGGLLCLEQTTTTNRTRHRIHRILTTKTSITLITIRKTAKTAQTTAQITAQRTTTIITTIITTTNLLCCNRNKAKSGNGLCLFLLYRKLRYSKSRLSALALKYLWMNCYFLCTATCNFCLTDSI